MEKGNYYSHLLCESEYKQSVDLIQSMYLIIIRCLKKSLGKHEPLQPLSRQDLGPVVYYEHRPWTLNMFWGFLQNVLYTSKCLFVKAIDGHISKDFVHIWLAIGVAQNRKLITQFKNRSNGVLRIFNRFFDVSIWNVFDRHTTLNIIWTV